MGGWNIFYGLLNFAILAAALYFIGWKLVVKMFKSRRDRIADELEQAKQAKEKAENIRAAPKAMLRAKPSSQRRRKQQSAAARRRAARMKSPPRTSPPVRAATPSR